MSRSFKKNLVVKGKSKYYQNFANRRLRRRKIDMEDSDPLHHKKYRLYTDTWNISDWTCRTTEEMIRRDAEEVFRPYVHQLRINRRGINNNVTFDSEEEYTELFSGNCTNIDEYVLDRLKFFKFK